MALPDERTLHTGYRIIGRSDGRNALQFAAYLSGQTLTCRETGTTYAPRSRPGIEFATILAPEGAPAWVYDRSELWNRVEETETRKNAQLGRDINVMLPYGLTPEKRAEIAQEITRSHFVSQGMICDIAGHRYGASFRAGAEGTAEKVAEWRRLGLPFLDEATSAHTETEHVMVRRKRDGSVKDYQLLQPHFHIFAPMRPTKADGIGFEGKTVGSLARRWNAQGDFADIRARIAARLNATQEAIGSAVRYDHRTYAERHKEALEHAHQARAIGNLEEAARQDARARHFSRDPEPYIGAVFRMKQLSERMRQRVNYWVKIKHTRRLSPQIEALRDRQNASLGDQVRRLIDLTAHQLRLQLPPDRSASLGR